MKVIIKLYRIVDDPKIDEFTNQIKTLSKTNSDYIIKMHNYGVVEFEQDGLLVSNQYITF